MKSNKYFTIYCKKCKKSNGCRIVGEDFPPLPKKPNIDCVFCKSEKVIYKRL